MKALHENNFWNENLEFTLIDEVVKFFEKDKSKNKEESSLTMWGIYYITHPNSKFFNVPNKKEIIAKSVFKNEKFKWESISDLIDLFKEVYLTDAERSLLLWNDTMRLRDRSLKEMYESAITNADIKSLVELDRMLAHTNKYFQEYKTIKAEFEAEKQTKKGKKNLSLSDQGVI